MEGQNGEKKLPGEKSSPEPPEVRDTGIEPGGSGEPPPTPPSSPTSK